jgi:hypothetical protein
MSKKKGEKHAVEVFGEHVLDGHDGFQWRFIRGGAG